MKGMPILAALVLACFSIPARAQSPEPAAATMTGLFPVYVLDRSGEETEGRLVSLTGSAVVLQTSVRLIVRVVRSISCG
jgi:hypothetical protein